MNPQAAMAAGTAEEVKSLPRRAVGKSTCKVSDLQCESLTNPLGLDERCPRLSWKILSSRNGTGQNA